MKLFEAIVEANNRAVRGDTNAGLRVKEYADSLPIVALTCIDPRLDPLMPEVLGIPAELFIWLRNAGNIITSPLSSTMRSLALACAIKGGKEIAIIGHTDCKVRQTPVSDLVEKLRKLGVDRAKLPENLVDYFGIFASERQNVIRACDLVRSSPLIGPKIPVHGLMVDIQSGLLEWLVNGYQSLGAPQSGLHGMITGQPMLDSLISKAAEKIGNMEIHSMKIGEVAKKIEPLIAEIAKAAPPKAPPPLRPAQSNKDTQPIQQPWKSSARDPK
ncbi:MAG: hypothetical protein EXS18_08150 [Verrucomicrobiae bacterium]|nr:hypothetical protein [Verrucomicrobiae bacterium]